MRTPRLAALLAVLLAPAGSRADDDRYFTPATRAALAACSDAPCREQALADATCEPPTTDVCKQLEYHQSWCGQHEFAANGQDPGWICREALGQSYAGHARAPGV